jgi:hypothetical protein
MKKGLLVVSILLFLASSVAIAFAVDRFSSAAEAQRGADRAMKAVDALHKQYEAQKATKPKAFEKEIMEKMQSEGHWIELEGKRASDARRLGLLGLGGGVVGLIASVFVFLRSRRRNPA